MKELCNNNLRRFFAGIMAFMILVFVLLSTTFIAAEADHDCEGEDCPVCATIQICARTLDQVGSLITVLATVLLPALIVFLSITISVPMLTRHSLIYQKIRMNN